MQVNLKRLFFLLFPIIVCSQDISEKEKLFQSLDTTLVVSEKVQLYTDLAWEYIITENDSALIYADKALQLSENENYYLGQAIAYEIKGLYHEIATGNYDQASLFYFEGIKVCETNNLDYVSSIYHSLGVMFHTSDNYEKALEYYTTSYNLALKANDSVLIKKCLINLGSVSSSLEDFDKASFYMEKSFDYKVRQELDFSTYCNLGFLYTKQKKYDKALPYLLKATTPHKDNPDSEINLYFLLHLKAKTKDTFGMKPVLKRAKIALNNVVGLRYKSLLLRNLADYYKSTNNYKEALHYRDQYVTVFEEIKEKQRDETVIELETKYETEKKDAQLKVLTLETEKAEQQKRLYLILAFAGLLVAGLIGFFLYKNKKQNTLLAKQKVMLEKTIGEKNILLRETHHRVKNSFQIVASLLYLQSENIEDKEAKIAMQEAQNRVRSMVLIHQKLYSKDQLVGIDTQEYFTDLANDIFESHQFEAKKIEYSMAVESLVLGVETITPLGLILNELITNVIKHAFHPITNESKMRIEFRKVGDILHLEVKDNGKGMPSDIKESSFGIQLITALAKKLKAKLTFPSSSEGTLARLQIHRFTEL